MQKSFTRRDAITGAGAAAGAIALACPPALAANRKLTSDSDDAEIKKFWAEFTTAYRKQEEIREALSQMAEAIDERLGEHPPYAVGFFTGESRTDISTQLHQVDSNGELVMWEVPLKATTFKEARAEVYERWTKAGDEWRAASIAAHDSPEYTSLSRRWNAALRKLERIAGRILAIEAETPLGVAIQLAAVFQPHTVHNEEDWEEDWFDYDLRCAVKALLQQTHKTQGVDLLGHTPLRLT